MFISLLENGDPQENIYIHQLQFRNICWNFVGTFLESEAETLHRTKTDKTIKMHSFELPTSRHFSLTTDLRICNV